MTGSNILFNKFDTVLFNNIPTKDFIKTYDLIDPLDNDSFVQTYSIEGSKTANEIAYELYGKESLYWVILFLNNIQDAFFDLPLSEDELKKIVVRRLEKNQLDIKEYQKMYTRESEENDKKRVIKVIAPNKMGYFLSLLNRAT